MPHSITYLLTMDPKPRPNHALYIDILRRMTPEQKVRKAFELSEFSKRVFLDGLRNSHPDMAEQDLKRLYLTRLAACHNRNY